MPDKVVIRNNLKLDRFNLEDYFRTYFQTPKLLVSAIDVNAFPCDTNSLEICHNFLGNNSMFKFLKEMNKFYVDYLNRFYSSLDQKHNYEVVEDTLEYPTNIKFRIPENKNGELNFLIFNKDKEKIDITKPNQLNEILCKGSIVKALFELPDVDLDTEKPSRFNITRLKFELKQIKVIVSKKDLKDTVETIKLLNSEKSQNSYFYQLDQNCLDLIISCLYY